MEPLPWCLAALSNAGGSWKALPHTTGCWHWLSVQRLWPGLLTCCSLNSSSRPHGGPCESHVTDEATILGERVLGPAGEDIDPSPSNFSVRKLLCEGPGLEHPGKTGSQMLPDLAKWLSTGQPASSGPPQQPLHVASPGPCRDPLSSPAMPPSTFPTPCSSCSAQLLTGHAEHSRTSWVLG